MADNRLIDRKFDEFKTVVPHLGLAEIIYLEAALRHRKDEILTFLEKVVSDDYKASHRVGLCCSLGLD